MFSRKDEPSRHTLEEWAAVPASTPLSADEVLAVGVARLLAERPVTAWVRLLDPDDAPVSLLGFIARCLRDSRQHVLESREYLEHLDTAVLARIDTWLAASFGNYPRDDRQRKALAERNGARDA